jgi:transcriptional regulator with XRE-family HTH domain
MTKGKDGAGSNLEALSSEQRLGETVRGLRSRQGLSLRTLATRAGFSPSFVSQIERGQASPSIASLERLAQALGVTLGEFFRPVATARVTRLGERAGLTSAWSHAQIEALGPTGPGRALESMMITLAPEGQSGGRPNSHGGDEFAFVFEGTVRLTLDAEVYDLARGDAATFPAEIPHRWENVGLEPARIVVVSVH